MRFVGVVVAMLALGCVRTKTERCGDRICPEGMTCSAFEDLVLCVSSAQTSACEDLDEGDACEVAQRNGDRIAGFCRSGACLAVGCGNGRIDDPMFRRDEECDDGNRISHDGCSSTCRDEQPRVHEVYPYGLYPLTEAAMIADTSSGQTLMFGGMEYGGGVSSKVWALVDDTWRLQHTQTAPSPRRGHGAVYDQRRQCVVMYGGSNTDSIFADTWEFDGTAWTARSSMHSPPPIQNHAMAYDPIRGVSVMFGGVADSPGSTWEWDGSDWLERVHARSQPLARVHHAMAYDPGRGLVVMVIESTTGVTTYELGDDGWHEIVAEASGPPSGARLPLAYDAVARRIVASADIGTSEQLWSWDGSAWTSVAVPTDVSPRISSAMTTGTDGHVLRAGGHASHPAVTPTVQTSRWDGEGWVNLSERGLEVNPRRRTGFAAAYDPLRHKAVLFGGAVPAPLPMGPTHFGDTWELGRTGWIEHHPNVAPAPRADHAMAYDPLRRTIVLFGDHTKTDGETWLWDGVQWTSKPAVVGLDPRQFAAMAYDAKRGVVVLFGGVTDEFTNDTWEWDGQTWTQKVPASESPAQRGAHAMAYDPIREQVILFGGRGRDATHNPIVYSDTWAWDGTSWTRLAPAAVPSSRSGHGLAWDAARGRLVLAGGIGAGLAATRDVWEWDGTTWTAVPVTLPVEAEGIAATPGFASGVDVITVAPSNLRMATLHVVWTADTPYETCTAADHDRDGLVGCADPDCWSRCSPSCVPGATCPSSEPHCGDGACSSIETCRSCPGDCGECPALCGDGTCSAGEDCVGDCMR